MVRPCSSSAGAVGCSSLSDEPLSGRMIGIALDALTGFTISGLSRSMLPKIEDAILPLSLPDIIGEVTEPEIDCKGVKEGASGRNVGAPAAEKLKSLVPGENTGALTLILVEGAAGGLSWLLECTDSGALGATPPCNTAGWNVLLPKLNCPGWKVLVGLNLNSGAATLSFEKEGLLSWLGRRESGCSFCHGLLMVENVLSWARWANF